MLNSAKDYKYRVYENLINLSENGNPMPYEMFMILKVLEDNKEIKQPKVIYDIGSSLLHWTNTCKKVYPDAKYYLFDAFKPAEILYTEYDYHIGLLGDEDNKPTKYYVNDLLIGGNSMYRENTEHYSPTNYTIENMRTLDSIVSEKGFLYPDLIKIDVQGAELEVLKGASECLKNCLYLIIEIQNDDSNYNIGCHTAKTVIPYIESLGFKLFHKICENPSKVDADYLFIKE